MKRFLSHAFFSVFDVATSHDETTTYLCEAQLTAVSQLAADKTVDGTHTIDSNDSNEYLGLTLPPEGDKV